MNKPEQAAQCFGSGFNCAQAILSTYSGDYGIDERAALKIASGFGAGMGRQCKTCGAVTGAYMVIGLKYGYTDAEARDGKEKAYALIREFSDRFVALNGSTCCEELLGVHLLTGDREKTAERVKEVCPKMVRSAAEILEEILNA